MINRDELKKTLIEQFEPFERAVSRKLKELTEDSDLDDDSDLYEADQNFDSSLASAFENTENHESVLYYEEPKIKDAFQYSSHPTTQPQYVNDTPTKESITEHNNNIAAKIAALRGITLPGDYLSKRP